MTRNLVKVELLISSILVQIAMNWQSAKQEDWTMTTYLENQESNPNCVNRTLHDFNNQVSRISLLVESLGQKIQTDQKTGYMTNSLIQKIQTAVVEAAESGKKLGRLVKNQNNSA